MMVNKLAYERHCDEVLWLFGEEKRLTEISTMNLFVYWTNEHGEKELLTPPLNGLILPGVTRRSMLALAKLRDVPTREDEISLDELMKAVNEKRVHEVFGTGTPNNVKLFGGMIYNGQHIQLSMLSPCDSLALLLNNDLLDIQHAVNGCHEWTTAL